MSSLAYAKAYAKQGLLRLKVQNIAIFKCEKWL
jgi:hypothetical protein